MLNTLGRVVLIPVAFVSAAAAALFVLVTLGQERVVQAMSNRTGGEDSIGAAIDLLSVARAIFTVNTLLPALLVIIVGEVARIRASLYYVIGGGTVLAVVPVLAYVGRPAEVVNFAPMLWPVFATAGFSGGFVYWLVAGRNA
jgi:hypothetical protein